MLSDCINKRQDAELDLIGSEVNVEQIMSEIGVCQSVSTGTEVKVEPAVQHGHLHSGFYTVLLTL